jgi:protein-disulfide isomerase
VGKDESDAWPPAEYVVPPEYPAGYPQQQPPHPQPPTHPHPQQHPQPPQQPQPHPPQPPYPPQPYPPQPYPPQSYPQPAYPPQPPAYPYPQPAYPQPWYPPGPPAKAPHGTNVWIITAVAVVGILSVLGVALFAILRDGGDPVAGPTPPGQSPGSGATGSPAGPSPAGPRPSADPNGGLVAGTGPVRVDVYVDQCPPCGTFESRTGAALDEYLASDRVTLRIHPVAFVDDRSKNNYATRAAAAVACAYESGKLVEFHSHLLRNQPAEDTFGPTDEQFASTGRDLGLDDEFGRCVTERRLVYWVAQATSAAQARGVDSVPAVYVNDREVEADRADLVAAITRAS